MLLLRKTTGYLGVRQTLRAEEERSIHGLMQGVSQLYQMLAHVTKKQNNLDEDLVQLDEELNELDLELIQLDEELNELEEELVHLDKDENELNRPAV